MNSRILHALKANRDWFLASGVLSCPDGFWGVAERMLLSCRNGALEKTLESFPSWTKVSEGYVIEQRRADCNFQCAWLFLQLAKLFDTERNRAVAENLLDYLYCRSGLLSHNKIDEPYPAGCWNWSHIRWTPSVFYDDNAWCIIIALAMAKELPALDERYQMTHYALAGARALYDAFAANFPDANPAFAPKWSGDLKQPHWGALAAAALARAAQAVQTTEADAWNSLAAKYFDFTGQGLETWDASELCYALLAVTLCESHPDFRQSLLPLGNAIADRLMARMEMGGGLLPAEHNEAPAGTHLADLIYTVNFAALAFSRLAEITQAPRHRATLQRLLDFLLDIQDTSASPRLKGCWRGMYDADARKWGGGDCFEGGASSIYTGWTNAPIGWTLAREAMNLT